MATFVRKLSIKSVLGNLKAFMKKCGDKELPDSDIRKNWEDGNSKAGIRLVGIIKSHEMVETDFGESVRFKGQFAATALIGPDAGAEYRSTQCFVPGVIEGMMLDALKMGGGEEVHFAFDIQVIRQDSAAVGYAFAASEIIESGKTDPLSDLLGKVTAAKPLALAAPSPAEPETAPSTEPATKAKKEKETA